MIVIPNDTTVYKCASRHVVLKPDPRLGGRAGATTSTAAAVTLVIPTAQFAALGVRVGDTLLTARAAVGYLEVVSTFPSPATQCSWAYVCMCEWVSVCPCVRVRARVCGYGWVDVHVWIDVVVVSVCEVCDVRVRCSSRRYLCRLVAESRLLLNAYLRRTADAPTNVTSTTGDAVIIVPSTLLRCGPGSYSTAPVDPVLFVDPQRRDTTVRPALRYTGGDGNVGVLQYSQWVNPAVGVTVVGRSSGGGTLGAVIGMTQSATGGYTYVDVLVYRELGKAIC